MVDVIINGETEAHNDYVTCHIDQRDWKWWDKDLNLDILIQELLSEVSNVSLR